MTTSGEKSKPRLLRGLGQGQEPTVMEPRVPSPDQARGFARASGSLNPPEETTDLATTKDRVEDRSTGPRSWRPDPDLAPGMMVGDYRIEEKIGEGGMGLVFSAVHPLISKRAAIKLLRPEMCADPGAVERFIDEARIVNQIGHPNLVDIFSFGQLVDGRHYLVMEWLKGETLRTRIARAPMSFAEVCAVLRPLGRALEAAHNAGVVHRDLKPDNVFLVEVPDEMPLVKLLDFGIAKLANTDHRMEQTRSGAIVGTPKYISPEQAKGQNVDHRADIYALGAITFELLTGRGPFVASSAMEIVAKHLTEKPVAPSTLVPGLPYEIDRLVLGMLAKDPSERPTLVQFQMTLERVRTTTEHPAYQRAATPPPFPVTPQRRLSSEADGTRYLTQMESVEVAGTLAGDDEVRVPSRRPWIALGAAATVIAAVVLGLTLSSSPSPSPDPSEPIQLPLSSPPPSPPPEMDPAPAAPAAPATQGEEVTPASPAHVKPARDKSARGKARPVSAKVIKAKPEIKSVPPPVPVPPPVVAPPPKPAGIQADGLMAPGSVQKK